MIAPTIKYLVLAMLVSSNTWASEEFFKQYPKACRANSTSLTLTKDSSPLVAVLKCLDAKDKEIASCKLGKACDRWLYEVYFNKENKYELLQKSYPILGDKPKISAKKDIVSVKSSFSGGSQANEEDKFRLEDGKLKLIGIEYSIVFNSQLVIGEDDPYASDFSVNTLTEKVQRTDHFEGPKTKKMTCKMNPKFKNLTIAESIDTSIDNLSAKASNCELTP